MDERCCFIRSPSVWREIDYPDLTVLRHNSAVALPKSLTMNADDAGMSFADDGHRSAKNLAMRQIIPDERHRQTWIGERLRMLVAAARWVVHGDPVTADKQLVLRLDDAPPWKCDRSGRPNFQAVREAANKIGNARTMRASDSYVAARMAANQCEGAVELHPLFTLCRF